MKLLNIYEIKNPNSFEEHGLHKKSSKLDSDISIKGKSNSKDIVTAFRGFYAKIYVNMCDDINALNEYLDLINISSTSHETLLKSSWSR